jgi:hypothetical protein
MGGCIEPGYYGGGHIGYGHHRHHGTDLGLVGPVNLGFGGHHNSFGGHHRGFGGHHGGFGGHHGGHGHHGHYGRH